MRRITAGFSIFELLIITVMAALGIAVKPVISSLVRIITGPLAIPSGVLAGGIYMMFLIMAHGLTRKKPAGTLTALVQALLVMLIGIGSHGIMSFITYLFPGIAVDIAMSTSRRNAPLPCFIAGLTANIVGTFTVGIILFNIPLIPLLLTLCVAALSGGIGGLFSYYILKQIEKLNILPDNNRERK